MSGKLNVNYDTSNDSWQLRISNGNTRNIKIYETEDDALKVKKRIETVFNNTLWMRQLDEKKYLSFIRSIIDEDACENDRQFGQFYTIGKEWLYPQIVDFIKNTGVSLIVDPFAGNGDLLEAVNAFMHCYTAGLDISLSVCERKGYACNDSLWFIRPTNGLIVTNPPYLAKNSAQRIKAKTVKYFQDNNYTDLYQLALEKCLESSDYVVAIIPETFILTSLFTDRLHSITVVENSLFQDTDCPVCVACFSIGNDQVKIYKNENYLFTLEELNSLKKKPSKKYSIIFNDKNGNIGLRAVDSTDDKKVLSFYKAEELGYSRDKICVSSRSMTYIQVNENIDLEFLVNEANKILFDYRDKTKDLLFAAFKGNNKQGIRRRRLDFQTARAILEEVLEMSNIKKKN